MPHVNTKTRQRLLDRLQRGEPLSRADRKLLAKCLHIVDTLQVSLRLALADVDGRIRDNNFLLVVALARKAEIAKLRSRARAL